LKPHYIDGTLAFMFETRLPVRPTRFALEEKILQHEYYECWQSLKKNFRVPQKDVEGNRAQRAPGLAGRRDDLALRMTVEF
jgi:hypothetical protein